MPETHFDQFAIAKLQALIRQINKTILNRQVCFYCGDGAVCEDHVVPHSFTRGYILERNGWEIDTVPACGECNALLGSTISETLKDRHRFLYDKIKVRYRKALRMPEWSDCELREMSPSMRGLILQSLEAKMRTVKRLEQLSRENATIPAISI